MTDLDITVTPPDPAYISIAAGVIRGLLQIASGLGFGWATFVTGDHITMIATAAVMTLTLLWSAWQKIRVVQKRLHTAQISAFQLSDVSDKARQAVAAAVAEPVRSGPL